MRRFSQAMAWPQEGGFAIDAALDERMAFVRKTYSTLFIQLIGVALATSLMVKTGLAEKLWPGGLLIGVLGLIFIVPRLIVPTASRGLQVGGASAPQ